MSLLKPGLAENKTVSLALPAFFLRLSWFTTSNKNMVIFSIWVPAPKYT